MAASDPIVTVSISCASGAEAAALAEGLVAARLAACAQSWPIRSAYRWQDAAEAGEEVLLVAKTVAARLPALEAFVLERHGYEVPEIVAQEVLWASDAYARWVRESVSG